MKVTGKVVYVTATLPLVLLLVFTIRACTLPGADTGLQYFFTPKWEEMLKPKVLLSILLSCHHEPPPGVGVRRGPGLQLGGHRLRVPDRLRLLPGLPRPHPAQQVNISSNI